MWQLGNGILSQCQLILTLPIKSNLMTIRFILLVSVVSALSGCVKSTESDKLQSELDSLRNELQSSQEMARTLNEVGVLMDSIDASRQALRLNMVEGTTYDIYVNRLEGLNSYVRETQNKINDLEKALKKSKSSANAFSQTIKKLKADVERKDREISELTATLEKVRNENDNLVRVTEMQELDLLDKQSQIEARRQELASLEQRIEKLLQDSQVSEADGLYARAKSVEETANRTKLAPKKKKASLKEALELYKKSSSLGNAKAKADVDRLTKELK